ncbi:4 SF II RNA helicase [Cryptosporidium ubiquitum]|uniref:DNA 3'-5' helicase n=1 Tax=Cryptosporidium ubiquitum TaxID=857276 RepID=A0A1J4MQG2_9CRYT|nr:4 SF II RNA helicase [Cryptosporidium ubiquitum]OII75244.1 4 SF II RNA helicase [Cryptosporidium ubiquitum]
MSTGNKRTIRQIYDGADLSDLVLNLPLTPYSEEFLSYKQKLDKALSDLKLLVQEQINKEEENLDLCKVLERVRESMSNRDDSCEQKNINDQIKQDKYYSVYLEIIQLEESRSDILECFIKWKNDHYYTRWEELSQPPQDMKDHWLRFKDKISKIILDSKKISSRPLPRLVVSENKPQKEDSVLDHVLKNMEKESSSDESKQKDQFEKAGDISIAGQAGLNKGAEKVQGEENENQKALTENADKLDDNGRKRRKRKQSEKGSSEFWGPKTLPKSKNRYISGISAVRAIRKRTYSNNGRIRMSREKELGPENTAEDGKENLMVNNEEQVRNLRRWERQEEKRNEIKFNRYLLKNKGVKKRIQESIQIEKEDILRDPRKWSNNFSQGCKISLANKSMLEDSSQLNRSLELSIKIKEEVNSLIHVIGNGTENDNERRKSLEVLGELCRHFLTENFGYKDFREGQLEAIYSVLLGGNQYENYRKGSVLILPTGYGKSLCFQYLSLLMNMWFGKITLVITPLISLMQDQLRSLSKKIRGAVWNSSVSVEEKKSIVELIGQGGLDILFVTPESMFSTFLTKGIVINQSRDQSKIARLDLSENRIALLCVDEAHCVCEWGHSFRPNYYSCIGHLINNFKVERVLGITATAPFCMLDELKSLLKVEKVIQPYSNQRIQRENLYCKVLHLDLMKKKAIQGFNKNGFNFTKVPKVYNNYSLIWDHIKYSLNGNNSNNNSQDKDTMEEHQLREKKKTRKEVWSKCKNILIYVWQRSEVEAVTNYLRTKGANALYYHGMMSNNEREMVQKSFIENKANIFVATTSFGMGIDKKDIDAVIHWNMPNSLEQYIQETGRCARQLDKLGICLMLLSDDDYKNKRQIISASLMDKTALRCLLHVILSKYNFGTDLDVIQDFEQTKIEFEIFPIELFKIVLNVRQTEEIENLLHHIKPYLDYLLGIKYKGKNVKASWVSYIRGSPYIKVRCFDEDFSKIKEKSQIFSLVSRFSTENSGVVTINLLEASMHLGKNLEELEDEIENERSVWKISVETLTNKQCIILGQSLVKDNSQCIQTEGFVSKKDFGALFLDFNSENCHVGTGVDTGNSKRQLVKENWVDLLVEDLHKELIHRNSNELWKLDIAYFSFQKFGMDKSCKDSIIESYFSNRKSDLYLKLFNQEICTSQNPESNPREGLEGVSRSFIRDLVLGKANNSQDQSQSLIENSSGDNTFENMIQEIWITKWNQELLHDLALGGKELVKLNSFISTQDRDQEANLNRAYKEKIKEEPEKSEFYQFNNLDDSKNEEDEKSKKKEMKEVYQKISSCIKSGVNCLLSNYLAELSPVQWETYRVSTERIISHFFSKAQKESKRRRREETQQNEGSRLDFSHYLGFEEFDVIFPADIARILVGVTSFRYCYKAKGGLKKDCLHSNDVVSSKLWGKFKSIPYSVVLDICQESFKEIIKNKLSI